MDVYEPGPGAPLHDLNPSPSPPTGLFWTIPIPAGSVTSSLADSYAAMQVAQAPVLDYGSFANATAGGGPAPVPATLAYRVVWGQATRRFHVDNPADGHSGDFMLASAQMEWTATAGDYYFASAPLETSSSSFAELGQEQNGVFFRQPGR